MKPRLLLVDDDALLLRGQRRGLGDDYEVSIAETGDAAIQLLAEDLPYAVVIADFKMPGMNGIQFLDRWRFLSPDTTRIMLTGQADLNMSIDAVNKGQVFRFLTKPINGDDLRLVLRDAVNQYELITAERTLLEQTLTGSVQTLVGLLSLFDPNGFGRAKEVQGLALKVSEKFSVAAGWDLGLAGLLSRIGWLAIPAEVQAKITRGERLDIQENEMVFRAPETGSGLLANIPRLQSVAQIIKYSRKNFNGIGYPKDQVTGSELPLGSRILKVVVDYLDHLQIRHSAVVVYNQIELGSGTKYDPEVVRALGEVISVASGPTAEKHVLLALDELRPGMILADNVYTADNAMIVLPTGTHLNLFHIERLRNYSAGKKPPEAILINRLV